MKVDEIYFHRKINIFTEIRKISVGFFCLGKPGKHFGACEPGDGMAPERSEFIERLKEKMPFGEMRVRDSQFFRIDYGVIGSHYVYVDHPVDIASPVVPVRHRTKAPLDLLYVGEDFGA